MNDENEEIDLEFEERMQWIMEFGWRWSINTRIAIAERKQRKMFKDERLQMLRPTVRREI